MPATIKKNIFNLDEFNRLMSNNVNNCKEILPAFSQTTSAIVLISSNEYAPFASVVVASIISNIDMKKQYDIVILTADMLLQNRWRIEKLGEGLENVSVRVIDISKMVEGFSFYTWAHFTDNTYYRLMIPDIFENYEKAIYLDSDVVVNHDISELFKTEMKGYYLAAAYDTHVISYCAQTPPLEQREYNINVLGMENPEQYFQAGVSIFNIREIRRDFEEGYLIKNALEHKLRWLDQDLLNKLFYNKILPLNGAWNVMIANKPGIVDEYHLPEELRKEYFESRKNPYIIHYVGRALPCYTTHPDLYEYFWKYARLTPFYEIILQRMAMSYTEWVRQQILVELKRDSFYNRVKNKLKKLANLLLPVGSKRRRLVKNIAIRFKYTG